MKYNFLKKDTKTNAVVLSVITSILLLALIIFAVMSGDDFKNVMVFGSSALVILTAIFIGVVEIKVFKDYKSQRKYLVSEGIFNICVSALIVITSFLFFLSGGESSIDLRYIISVFVLAFAVWKMIAFMLALKEKRNNSWLEVLLAIFWLSSGLLLIFTIKSTSDIVFTLFAISNVVLIILEIVFILYSYIFNKPVYLENEEAIRLLDIEEKERLGRLNRYNMMSGKIDNVAEPNNTSQTNTQQTIKTKLANLNSLKLEGVITEEEYNEKRKQIIDENI